MLGTTKVQLSAGGTECADGAEARTREFSKKIEKCLQNSQKQCMSPPFGTILLQFFLSEARNLDVNR